MQPTPGRIVLYTLRDSDVQLINHQRQRGDAGARQRAGLAAVGNEVAVGDVYPAMVVRVFDAATEGEANLQVHLDGSDTFWACSRKQAHASAPGFWHWPPRVPF